MVFVVSGRLHCSQELVGPPEHREGEEGARTVVVDQSHLIVAHQPVRISITAGNTSRSQGLIHPRDTLARLGRPERRDGIVCTGTYFITWRDRQAALALDGTRERRRLGKRPRTTYICLDPPPRTRHDGLCWWCEEPQVQLLWACGRIGERDGVVCEGTRPTTSGRESPGPRSRGSGRSVQDGWEYWTQNKIGLRDVGGSKKERPKSSGEEKRKIRVGSWTTLLISESGESKVG